MAKSPDKKTSPTVATKASKALKDPKSTKAEKSVAASDLAQAKTADKQTSPKVATKRARPQGPEVHEGREVGRRLGPLASRGQEDEEVSGMESRLSAGQTEGDRRDERGRPPCHPSESYFRVRLTRLARYTSPNRSRGR